MTMLLATIIIIAMVYGLIKKYETRLPVWREIRWNL